MQVRHTVRPSRPLNLIDIRFNEGSKIFTVSTPTGYAIYRTWPLTLLRKHDLSNGSLSMIQPVQTTSLLLLVGGRRSPLYPPNKVVVWDDAAGHEVAELEFRERVLGLQTRRDWIVVALKRRVVTFRILEGVITRHQEYPTGVNTKGLLGLATATKSTILAVPASQTGLVQIIHLPPCPAPPVPPVKPPPTPYDPPAPLPAPSLPPLPPNHHSLTGKTPVTFITAHTAALATLTASPSGRLLATTSETGTLVRIWDAWTGALIKELRRGFDKAEMYGVTFRPDEREVCVWSDKGTVHVFKILPTPSASEGKKGTGSSKDKVEKGNRQSTLQSLTPFLPIKLPKYFASEWSYAWYRLPAPTAHIALQSAMRGGGERGDGGKLRAKDGEGVVIPDDDGGGIAGREQERCVVGWIEVPVRISTHLGSGTGAATSKKGKGEKEHDYLEEMQYQLVALTYSGCWYRLSIPSSTTTPSNLPTQSPTSPTSPSATQGARPASPSSRTNPITIPGHHSGKSSASTSTSLRTSPRLLSSALPSTSPRSPTRPSPLSQATTSSSSAASTATATVVGMARPRSSTPTGARTTTGGPSIGSNVNINIPRGSKGKEREVAFASPATVTGARTRKDSHGSTASTTTGSKSDGSGEGGKTSRKCNVEEFRRFGRWDGWG